MAARVSQVGGIAVTVGTPKVRASQVGGLAVTVGTPKVRASQVGLLVIYPRLVTPAPRPIVISQAVTLAATF